MRISEFIDKTAELCSPDDVFDLFCTAAGDFGFERIAFAATTLAAQQSLARRDLKPVVALNFPNEWVQHYFAQGYQDIDPIIQLTPTADWPLVWDEIAQGQPITAKAKQMFNESREAGLHTGVSIPVHGPRGESYVISLASSAPQDVRVQDLPKLQAMANQFYLAYARRARPEEPSPGLIRLTDREKECLTWSARGKSAWAVSMILGISEHTVNFHLKGVMRKLKTGNRVQAIVLAVRSGLIAP